MNSSLDLTDSFVDLMDLIAAIDAIGLATAATVDSAANYLSCMFEAMDLVDID